MKTHEVYIAVHCLIKGPEMLGQPRFPRPFRQFVTMEQTMVRVVAFAVLDGWVTQLFWIGLCRPGRSPDKHELPCHRQHPVRIQGST